MAWQFTDRSNIHFFPPSFRSTLQIRSAQGRSCVAVSTHAVVLELSGQSVVARMPQTVSRIKLVTNTRRPDSALRDGWVLSPGSTCIERMAADE